MTARQMIEYALQEIGAIAADEFVSDSDAKAGLVRLNSLLDTWQTERLTIYNLNRGLYTIVANQAAYTIGVSGADWTCAVRPVFIQRAGMLDTDDMESPVEILTQDRYAAISDKTQTSDEATALYYNPTVPLGTVTLWPVPTDATNQSVLYIPLPLTAGLTLDSTLTLAPAYEEAIRYNLAVRLCPVMGRPLDPLVAQLALESKKHIKSANTRVAEMVVDPAIPGADGGAWDIFSGGM